MTSRQFAERCERYRRPIYAIAKSLWANPLDAEEAVARVRAHLLSRAGEIRPHGFLSLWRTALANDAISYLRKRRREIDLARAAAVEHDAARFAEWGYSPKVLFALATLTEEERYVVLTHVQQGLTLTRIGQALGISGTTVGKIYKMARAKLAIELRDYALNYYRIREEDVARTIEWAMKVLQTGYESEAFDG